jgi:hypothetical protein
VSIYITNWVFFHSAGQTSQEIAMPVAKANSGEVWTLVPNSVENREWIDPIG